jgi:hypothetical protein
MQHSVTLVRGHPIMPLLVMLAVDQTPDLISMISPSSLVPSVPAQGVGVGPTGDAGQKVTGQGGAAHGNVRKGKGKGKGKNGKGGLQAGAEQQASASHEGLEENDGQEADEAAQKAAVSNLMDTLDRRGLVHVCWVCIQRGAQLMLKHGLRVEGGWGIGPGLQQYQVSTPSYTRVHTRTLPWGIRPCLH